MDLIRYARQPNLKDNPISQFQGRLEEAEKAVEIRGIRGRIPKVLLNLKRAVQDCVYVMRSSRNDNQVTKTAEVLSKLMEEGDRIIKDVLAI